MSENLSYSAKSEVANLIQRRTRLERIKIALSKAPLSAWFGMTVLFIYFFAAIFAPFIAPHGEAEIFPHFGYNNLGLEIIPIKSAIRFNITYVDAKINAQACTTGRSRL